MQIHKKSLIPVTKLLRSNQTPWESKLWYHLRGGRFGHKFKRQVMIGEYIADFCCNEKKLIIELDGGQHNEPSAESKDQKRTESFQRYGYTVLRCWDSEVDTNLEGVLQKIKDTIDKQ